MLDEAQLSDAMQRALSYSAADQTEVVVQGEEQALTRYANNIIHQNVASEDATLTMRAVFGQQTGVATTNRFDDDALRAVVARAAEIARQQPPDPDFNSLPGPQPLPPAPDYDEATRQASPTMRAAMVKTVIDRAKSDSLNCAGAFSTVYRWLGVANSLGVYASYGSTRAHLTTTQIGPISTGYWEATAAAVDDIDAVALADRPARTAASAQPPAALEPGEYDVVLSPLAVSELIEIFSYTGLGALDVQEGTSFMAGHFGEKLVSDLITLYDDGLAAGGLPTPFDYEGQPKQRARFFERGVAHEVVYDSLRAAKEGRQTTGHAMPPPSEGPLPGNVFLAPGDASEEQMIAATRRGIYVTRFWYNRVAHQTKTIITGMTRDGAYLIEDGKISTAIKNMRYTESILRALSKVQMVGSQPLLFGRWLTVSVPALKIAAFTFTGRTELLYIETDYRHYRA